MDELLAVGAYESDDRIEIVSNSSSTSPQFVTAAHLHHSPLIATHPADSLRTSQTDAVVNHGVDAAALNVINSAALIDGSHPSSAGVGVAMDTAGYSSGAGGAGYMPRADEATALERAVPADKLRAMLQTQLEYYFSAENLTRDKYLLTQMDRDQWVPISIVAGFNQVRKMTNRLQLVVDVLRGSSLVEVDDAGVHVRPANKRCAVILREIPQDTRVEEVEALFQGDGCPAFIECMFAHNDSWYVTFSNEDEAHRAYLYLRETVRTFHGKPIMARMKTRPPLSVNTSTSTAAPVSAPLQPPPPPSSTAVAATGVVSPVAVAAVPATPPSMSTYGVQVGQNGVVSPPAYNVSSATVMPLTAPKCAYTTLPAVQYIQHPGFPFLTPTNVWPYLVDPTLSNITPMCFPTGDVFPLHVAPAAAAAAASPFTAVQPAANIAHYPGSARPRYDYPQSSVSL